MTEPTGGALDPQYGEGADPVEALDGKLRIEELEQSLRPTPGFQFDVL
jgi:hypothetical protein